MQRRIEYVFLFSAWLLSSCTDKIVIDTRLEKGDVFLVYVDNTQKQITTSGRCTEAVLSPGGDKVSFICAVDSVIKNNNPLCSVSNAICLYDIRTGKVDTVVKPSLADGEKATLMDLDSLAFSPDSLWLYFSSCAWVTSRAIHRYNMYTAQQQFFTDGNSLKVVSTGKYRGCLIISKHKYNEQGGSYDNYWLVDENGKEIRDIGRAENNF